MRRFTVESAFGIASQGELWAGTMNDIVAANLDAALLSRPRV